MVLVRAEHAVQVLGVPAEVGASREGLRHWQTVLRCLEARVVPGAGAGEKQHDCDPCTLTTLCLRSLQK